jgi:hypothetical protein
MIDRSQRQSAAHNAVANAPGALLRSDNVERSYRRSTAVGRRRELMEAWAQHVTGQ